MKRVIPLLVAVSLAASVGAREPSSAPATPGRPRVVPATAHDESPALRDIRPGPADPARENREMRRHLFVKRRRGGGPGSQLPDSVVQSTPGLFTMPAPGRSFDGVGNVDFVVPPDPNGAVGPNHYVQFINTSFAIFNKSGTLLYGPAEGSTLWSGFGGPCEEGGEGDPIVLHDHLADRWLMSQLALPNFPFGPFYQCVAVSATADPTGAWHRYAFVVSDTKLNDYPKLAVWPDAYYLTVNQFDAITSAFLGQGVLAFERDNMLAGLPASMIYFDLFDVDPNLGGMLPADMDGPPPPAGSPAYFVQMDDDGQGAPQDQLQLWRFHVDWTNPSASTFTGPALLATAPFDSNMCGFSRNCIPQRGTSRKLDAISDRLMYRLQYRNFGDHETLVVNHTVDVGGDHAGIRWYELRDPGGAPFIRQQGTYAPDANHRWMGSAAMDGAGDIAIGYSVSSGTVYPSVGYAGRLVDDPLGTLPQAETALVVGAGSQTDSSGRWGDYSSLSVDPTDHCTFWYTQEYYSTTSNIGWRTRIGSFRFPSCTVTQPFVTVVATVPNASEAGLMHGTFTVSRTGATDAPLTVQYTVRGTATPGADYVPLPASVTIPTGSATATVDVVPIDDTLIEEDETVVVTLTADAAYSAGTPSSAIVTIINDDLPPDLVIAALSAPTTGGAGTTITVGDTTKNQGGGDAGASTTRFYLSTNSTLDAADVVLGSRAIPPLARGTTSVGSTAVTIPSGTAAGTYYIIARADADGVVDEGQEGNNTSSSVIVIGADLTVTAFTVPTAAGAGVVISVTDTTQNQGGGLANPSTTAFYLSTNNTFDAGDVLLGTRAVPALAAGAASAATTSLTIPAATGIGTYYVIARADDGNVVGETQEANNTSARPVVMGPDLLVWTVSVPLTGAAGAPIIVTDTIRNLGGGPAGASTSAFYLSTNATFDGGDVLLGSRAVPAIGPGAQSVGSTAVTIPAGTAPGTWYVIVRADDGNVVAETQEGNNVAAGIVQVGADLVIAPFTVPTTGGAGAVLSVTDTTKNQGGDAAGASTTRFWLSTDTVLDGADVVLGSRGVGTLAAGGTSAATTALTIPAGTAPGAYFVIAQADADNAVPESTETNNTSARPVQVSAGP